MIETIPMQSESDNKAEEEIARLVGRRPLSIEEAIANSRFDETETLSAVRRLVRRGDLYLVVVAYPWGIEYDLELTEEGRRKLDGNEPTMVALPYVVAQRR